MTKIRKPVQDGVANRFHYKGSEYDIRMSKSGLKLFRDSFAFTINTTISNTNMQMGNLRFTYYKWRNGGHI